MDNDLVTSKPKRNSYGKFARVKDSRVINELRKSLRERILEAAPLIREEELDPTLNEMSGQKMLILDLMSNPMKRMTYDDVVTTTGISAKVLQRWSIHKNFVYLKQILEKWYIDHELAPVFFDVLLEILTKRDENGRLIRDAAMVKALDLCAGKIGFQAPKQIDMRTIDESKERDREFIRNLWDTDEKARIAMKQMMKERKQAAIEVSAGEIEVVEEKEDGEKQG